jgi:hypothetical protein
MVHVEISRSPTQYINTTLSVALQLLTAPEPLPKAYDGCTIAIRCDTPEELDFVVDVLRPYKS